MLVVGDIQTFTATVTFAPWVAFVRPDFRNSVVFDAYFKSAVRETKATARFMP
jgi:hypothetical protein